MTEEQIKRLEQAMAHLCPDTIEMLVDNWIDTLDQIEPDEEECPDV